MHSAYTREKRRELDQELNAIANSRELVRLAMREAATLNRGEWVLIFGHPDLIPQVRATLAREGIAHFDLTIYEACAHENLYLSAEEIFEEFFKPFCKKTPVHEAWFTPEWESFKQEWEEIPMLPMKRQFLQIEEQWTIVDRVSDLRRASG